MPSLDKAENLATLVITILGVAYPIILEINSRLNDKYGSRIIVKLFEQSREYRYFIAVLISSLVVLLLWVLDRPPLFDFSCFKPIILNSATLLLILFSIGLTISFFHLVKLTLIFNNPEKLINYLKFKCLSDESSERLSEIGLMDIFLLSIKKQDHPAASEIGRFFYTAFQKERIKQSGKPVVYPDRYYQLVYRAIEELRVIKDNRNRSIEVRTSGSIWLLGELKDTKISDETYRWIWRNLSLAIEYDDDELVIHHWKTAHQYMEYSFDRIYPEFARTPPFNQLNEDEVEEREKERNKFLRFHIALGGLLMYKQRYKCISRMFSYTQSEPPRYPLLPNNMTTIFEVYSKFRDRYDQEYNWISNIFPFPDSEGIGSENLIRKWVFHYLAVLFLRQFTLHSYLIIDKPINLPEIPKSQSEKRHWLEGLEYFEKTVSSYLGNQQLLDVLGFNYYFDSEEEYLRDRTLGVQEGWSNFFERLRTKILEQFQVEGQEIELDQTKVNQFKETSRKTLNEFLQLTATISNEDLSDTNSVPINEWKSGGQKVIMDKEAYGVLDEIYYHERDSFLSDILVENLRNLVGYTFEVTKTLTFNIKREEMTKALESLNLNKNHIIVNFGMMLFDNKVEAGTKHLLGETEVINFGFSRGTFPSLFILCKSDLPKIICNPISEEEVKKYDLKKLSERFEVYWNVLDLNKFPDEVALEYPQGRELNELKRSALLYLELDFQIKWKKDARVLQIFEYSQYHHKGIPAPLDQIKFEWTCNQENIKE
ncbi:MAG: hypothetical protein IPM74_12330 [Crocinitomicaceae bacterium]|nr:hypothetical protein [Crocinitomicaceae bacterium]MBK8926662.1 hypothetical protein [Crocinitomicaceae bacterium]